MRFWTLVPRMQATTSVSTSMPAQTASWLTGSGGPITLAPVTHAARCRPSSPEQASSICSPDSMRVPLAVSTNERYQQTRTNSSGWAPHSCRGSVTIFSGLAVASMPFTANQ